MNGIIVESFNIIFIVNRTNYSSYLAIAIAVAIAPHYYNCTA